jgi:hypothetical protein
MEMGKIAVVVAQNPAAQSNFFFRFLLVALSLNSALIFSQRQFPRLLAPTPLQILWTTTPTGAYLFILLFRRTKPLSLHLLKRFIHMQGKELGRAFWFVSVIKNLSQVFHDSLFRNVLLFQQDY